MKFLEGIHCPSSLRLPVPVASLQSKILKDQNANLLGGFGVLGFQKKENTVKTIVNEVQVVTKY